MFSGRKACDICGHGIMCAIKMDYEQYLNAIEYAEKSCLSSMSNFGGLEMSIRDKYFTTESHCDLWMPKQEQKLTRKALYSDKMSRENANLAENYGE